MKSCRGRLMKLALVTSLVAGSMSATMRAANADPNTLRAKAQVELTAVTRDVDKANIMFSPAATGARAAVRRRLRSLLRAGSVGWGIHQFTRARIRTADGRLQGQRELIGRPCWRGELARASVRAGDYHQPEDYKATVDSRVSFMTIPRAHIATFGHLSRA
jgi:hypothetical protein